MKLIIQIPCYNEAQSLPIMLSFLPRKVAGFECVEWLVIDDGSTDGTSEVARLHGVDHVVRHVRNKGLARTFMTGLDACINAGADVIVNTDADNQYNADDIPSLVKPILEQRAELVIGARPIASIANFSFGKKLLQRFGSFVVRWVSKTDVTDAPSGFRALSRVAAQRLMVFSDYTYTIETIIQAGQKNMAIMSVPIRVNEDLRPSRLVRSIPSYIKRSIVTMIRIFMIYRPFQFFATIASFFFGAGLLVCLRFLWKYMQGGGLGHVQSLILASILLGFGFHTYLIALVTNLLSANRKLLEDIRFKTFRLADLQQAKLDIMPGNSPTRKLISPELRSEEEWESLS